MKYFFDTYAIIEIMDGGNQKYAKYAKEPICTGILNLWEFHYYLLKNGADAAMIDAWYGRLESNCIGLDTELVKDATELKFNHKKKGLSFPDCAGYLAAKKNGLVFLTGDKEFEGLDNVELVR